MSGESPVWISVRSLLAKRWKERTTPRSGKRPFESGMALISGISHRGKDTMPCLPGTGRRGPRRHRRNESSNKPFPSFEPRRPPRRSKAFRRVVRHSSLPSVPDEDAKRTTSSEALARLIKEMGAPSYPSRKWLSLNTNESIVMTPCFTDVTSPFSFFPLPRNQWSSQACVVFVKGRDLSRLSLSLKKGVETLFWLNLRPSLQVKKRLDLDSIGRGPPACILPGLVVTMHFSLSLRPCIARCLWISHFISVWG